MWERTLEDLIRGIRANQHRPQHEFDVFLSHAIDEIRAELKGKDMDLKAKAVLKMVYLMMLYPVSPPPSFAFHVVEVMSSQKYHLKEVGYLAAETAFPEGTEEVVLTVNGLKKDLLSPDAPPVALALSTLPALLNTQLAQDLTHDISSLLTHSKPAVRKRAVLCLYRVFEKYPEALVDNVNRLRERLLDDDQGVVSATVNVLTELAAKNAVNYLPLAPTLFEILSTSQNNWMLIKVVKLFALLTPHEPRLIKKLLPPLTSLITTTSAISLLYECVRTCLVGGMLGDDEAGEALARVCVGKLGGFLGERDMNLKYIALLALVYIVPSHPHLIEDYQDVILSSVDDPDLSIRLRALELLKAMANRDNAQSIIDHLLSLLASPPVDVETSLPNAASSLLSLSGAAPVASTSRSSSQTNLLTPSYRLTLTKTILAIGSADTFAAVPNFVWYLSVLIDLAYIARVDVGREIRAQVVEIVGRVRDVRPSAVELLGKVLRDAGFLESAASGWEGVHADGGESSWGEVLAAAAWVCGEHAEFLPSPPQAAMLLLEPDVARLAPGVQSVCVHASVKIFAFWAARKAADWDASAESGDVVEVRRVLEKLVAGLGPFLVSAHAEVKERAAEVGNLFAFVKADLDNYKPGRSASPLPTATTPPTAPTADSTSVTAAAATLDEPSAAAGPSYPKSLLLLAPLFTSHALPPVSSRAQGSIAVPDALDLDRPLFDFGPARAAEAADESDESDDEPILAPSRRDVLRPETSLSSGRVRTKEEEELLRVVAASGGRVKKAKGKGKAARDDEDPEERKRRKAARLAKQRADPYYIQDSRRESADLSAIPVVKLDLGLSGAAREPEPRKTKKKRAKATGPPPVIDVDGEMPDGTLVGPSASTSAAIQPATRKSDDLPRLADIQLNLDGGPRSSSSSSAAAARKTSRFVEYDEGDADDRSRLASAAPSRSDTPDAAPRPPAPAPLPAPPAAEMEGVEVVRVVKKKKKPKPDGTSTPGASPGLPEGASPDGAPPKRAKKKKAAA